MKISKLAIVFVLVGILCSVDAFAGSYRTPCPAGSYSERGAAKCISCSTLGSNRYSAKQASSTCDTCPKGQVANKTATACIEQCKSDQFRRADGQCVACPKGYKCDGTSGVFCAPGYYKLDKSNGSATCHECEAGYYCVGEVNIVM